MAANGFAYKNCQPDSDFDSWVKEQLDIVMRWAPFGASAVGEIEWLPQGGCKASLRVTHGMEVAVLVASDEDAEVCMQKLFGTLRSKLSQMKRDRIIKMHEAEAKRAAEIKKALNKVKFSKEETGEGDDEN